MIDNTKALRIAAPKPSILKPLTVTAVSQNIKPLMTRVNKPSVNTFNGRVKMIRTGRMMALMIPRNTEPTMAPHMVRLNPSISWAVIRIAMI